MVRNKRRNTRGALGTDPKRGNRRAARPTQQAAKPAQQAAKPAQEGDVKRQQRRLTWLKKNRPNDPEVRKLERKVAAAPSAQPPAPTPFPQMSPEQQTQAAFTKGGEAYMNVANRFLGSDPYAMQARYEPGFMREMERARGNVLSQFERRNAEEFGRQNIATQQQIAERGLDPNSEAAQALMRANTQRQDLARQEALSAAEQAAYGVQQQGYTQAYQTGMMPFEQFQALQGPLMAGVGAQYAGQEAEKQRQFEARQAQLTRQAQQRIAAMNRPAAPAQPDYFSNYLYQDYLPQQYAPQAPKPNPWAGAAQAGAQAAGAVIGQNLKRG